MDEIAIHSECSSNREKLVEHIFIVDVMRYLWQQGIRTAECLRPEVDSGGYDVVLACNGFIRHIQLKSSYYGAKTARQTVHLRLAEKPSGCVVWIMFDEQTLNIRSFLWFGGQPGEPFPNIQSLPPARHTKGNSLGVKALRPNLRVIKRASFRPVESVSDLVELLFGVENRANRFCERAPEVFMPIVKDGRDNIE